MMPGMNYVIYGCSSARTVPRVSLISVTELNTIELNTNNIVAVITQDRVIDDNLKTQIKNQTFLYL